MEGKRVSSEKIANINKLRQPDEGTKAIVENRVILNAKMRR